MSNNKDFERVLKLLDQHFDSFHSIVDVARETKHPVPTDTRAWSQIIVSVLTGIPGIERKKGTDLADGSDVKGANTWEAIDTPRFNGVIKAGTKSDVSGSMKSLDAMPFLFFVLWDETKENRYRCRIWVVRTQYDEEFRRMSKKWYEARRKGDIISSNFQLHPPRGLDHNTFRNTMGNLEYPLMYCAERNGIKDSYELKELNPDVMESGNCK